MQVRFNGIYHAVQELESGRLWLVVCFSSLAGIGSRKSEECVSDDCVRCLLDGLILRSFFLFFLLTPVSGFCVIRFE